MPEPAVAVLQGARHRRPTGLSQPGVADALWVLRSVLAFARANGLVPPGFDPTEGLEAPKPDAAVARTPRPTVQPRPLSFPECAGIVSHLHPVHQLVLWLQPVMGLRISEAFGVLVDDVIDLGDVGLLVVQGQGGRYFRIGDDNGRVVKLSHKETTKTEAASRTFVIPRTMIDLVRVAVEAFHTDPDTGEVNESARLVPGLRIDNEFGQLGFFPAVIASDANVSTANLMRTEFHRADLHGANFDRTALTKTSFAHADLRICSFRGAKFDRTHFHEATFGNLDAAGASGTLLPGPASIETPDGLRVANENESWRTYGRRAQTFRFGYRPRRPRRAVRSTATGRGGAAAANDRRDSRGRPD